MQDRMQLDMAIRDFGNKNNLDININQGASVISLENEKEIWIEAPQNSVLLVVHTRLCEVNKISISQGLNLLQQNLQLQNMMGAYLGIDEKTSTVRLCVSVPVKVVSVELLSNVIDNLIHLSETIKI
ncbi:MAG: CesT family type III secretion system chaperone [Pseudomonadota bacterium]